MTECEENDAVLGEFTWHMLQVLDLTHRSEEAWKASLLEEFIRIIDVTDDFSITAEEVALFTDTRVDTVRRHLRIPAYGFKEGEDYVIEQVRHSDRDTRGQRLAYEYFVSVDCFIKLCMLAASAEGALIRDVLVAAFKQYHSSIDDAISRRRRSLK